MRTRNDRMNLGNHPTELPREARSRPGGLRLRSSATLLALIVGATLTGCAPHYKILLNNGNTITTRGKPKLDSKEGVYRYKDAAGKSTYMPAFRVKEIEPM